MAKTSYGGSMPSPVGHALGGAIVGLVMGPLGTVGTVGTLPLGTSGTVRTLGTVQTLGTLALVAVLPDVDFLWGRHSMETHSLAAAVLAGLAVLGWTSGRNPRLALAVALAWASHILFDWLGSDTTPPLGVMAFWPFTSQFYFADAFFFEAISRRYWLDNFYTHNLYAVAKEVAILGPVAAVAWLRIRSKIHHTETQKH